MTRNAQPAVTSTSENRISRALHNSLQKRRQDARADREDQRCEESNCGGVPRRAEHTWPRHAEPEDRGEGQPDIGESRELRIAPVYPGGLRISPLRMKYANDHNASATAMEVADPARTAESSAKPTAAMATSPSVRWIPVTFATAVPSKPGKNLAQYSTTTGKPKVQTANEIRIRFGKAGREGELSGRMVSSNCHPRSRSSAVKPAKIGASQA